MYMVHAVRASVNMESSHGTGRSLIKSCIFISFSVRRKRSRDCITWLVPRDLADAAGRSR